LVNINFSIVGKNNDEISLTGPDYVLETGATGFGIPQPQVRIDPSAGNGGKFKYLKRGVRVLDLPIAILSNDQENLEPKLRRLARAMAQDFTLKATYATGEVWSIVLYLDGGAETTFGSDANKFFARWVISARAPQPFWVSAQAITFSVQATEVERGLLGLSDGQRSLSQLQVSSGQALGTILITNTGDVETPVSWRIDGPASSVEVQLNGGTGFSYEDELLTGESILINTDLGTVLTETGANAYSGLGAAPKLFDLPAGNSIVNITATGADEETKISGSFNPRREVLH
jgi:hypothetical protein